MISSSGIYNPRFLCVGLNGFYTLGSSMVTGIRRGTLSKRKAFRDLELGVVFLKSLSIYHWKLIFRCSMIGPIPVSTSNPPWLRFPPFFPRRQKTMQLKAFFYGMSLVTIMITSYIARWKAMQFKAPLYTVPLITTMITSHLASFLIPSKDRCVALLHR